MVYTMEAALQMASQNNTASGNCHDLSITISGANFMGALNLRIAVCTTVLDDATVRFLLALVHIMHSGHCDS